MYIVGTPRKIVTRSSTMVRSASSPSNFGSRVRQAPPAIAAFSPQVWPKEWKSGSPPKITSPGPLGIKVSTVVVTLLLRFAWLSSAPLGDPVVPEV